MGALPALLLAAAAAAGSDAPLGVRTQGTLRELFLDPVLADARPPARPALDLRWAAANSWSTPTRLSRGTDTALLQTDGQADTLGATVRLPWRALGISGATAVEARLVQHWGGYTDGVITTWHRVLHVSNYERARHPADAVRIRLGDERGGGLALSGARLAAGDLAVRSQARLLGRGIAADGERDRVAVALRLDAKAPLGSFSTASGSGGFDAALGLAVTAELAPWATLHGMASATVVSPLPRRALVQPRRAHGTADLSLALRRGGWTFLVEDRVSTPLLEPGWSYAGTGAGRRASGWFAGFRPQNQVSAGVRRGRFTVWFSEDVTPGTDDRAQAVYYLSNAPDFTFGVAFASP